MNRIDLRNHFVQCAGSINRQKIYTISSVTCFGRNPNVAPGAFGCSLPNSGVKTRRQETLSTELAFCCPSDRKYNDGEGDNDVEDLTHDGVRDEGVNPRTRD